MTGYLWLHKKRPATYRLPAGKTLYFFAVRLTGSGSLKELENQLNQIKMSVLLSKQTAKEAEDTPRAYWLKKGIKRPGKGKQQPTTKWNSSTVTKILFLQEYCGDIFNFKTYSKSYKNKKRLENDRENWVIFKDVHEPIIERSVFEQVQQKRGKIRKRRTNDGGHNMFSGFLVCADCGSNLHFHFNHGNPEIKYFNCSNYKGTVSEWIFWNRWCLVKSDA